MSDLEDDMETVPLEQFEDALALFRAGDDGQAHQAAKALLEQAPGHVGGMMLLLATAGGSGDERAINDALLEISEFYAQLLLVPEVLELFQSQLLEPVVRSQSFRTLFAPALRQASLRIRDGAVREVAGHLIQEAARDAMIEAALARAPLTEAPPVLTGEAIHLVDLETGDTVANLCGEGSYLVGRDPKAKVCLDDLFVSRQHLELSRRDGLWVVQSLSPTNPSALNGRRMGLIPAPLRHGDELRVGEVALGVFSGVGESVEVPAFGEADPHSRTQPVPVKDSEVRPRNTLDGAEDGGSPGAVQPPLLPRA